LWQGAGAIVNNLRKKLFEASLPEMIMVRWNSAILLVVFAVQAFGQTASETQPPPVAPEQLSGISTTVNEVSLDLVVHDKRHNGAPDLKAEDLVVTDDGQPVKLTGIRLVSGDAAMNRGHLVMLVFDPFHGPTAKSVRVIADRILSVLPAAGYRFAVLDFRGRLRLMQGFTDNRQAVQQAVDVLTESKPITMQPTLALPLEIIDDKAADEDRAKISAQAEKNMIAIAQTGVDSSGRGADVKERALAQTLLTALNDSVAIIQEHGQEQRGKEQPPRLYLAALLALVRSQRNLSERKALIYFTQNQQMDPASKKMLQTITGAAARAGVSIYTVDMDTIGNSSKGDEANGLMNGLNPTTGAGGVQESSSPIKGAPSADGRGFDWTNQQDIQVITDFMRSSGEDRTDPFADTKSPMADFSKATGGAYIDGQNSTKKPLEQLVQDLTTYYQASYVPPIQEYDGKFRTIAVKPLRAGLTIQTKTGYFALAPGADGGIQPFEAPLLKTIALAKLPTDVKFHAAVLRFGDLPDGNSNSVAVEVPLSELATKVDAKTNLSSAHVSIVAQIKDKSGTVVEHYSQDITKRGVTETLAHDHQATIAMERHFICTPGKYTMEVAVLDQNSGKAGARRSGFEIPDLPATVALSDMVLVRSMEGSHDVDDDPLEPLRYEHKNVTPNLTGELPGSARDVSLFFILHPDASANEPMTLEMELIHNGNAGRRMPLLHSEGAHAPVPYLASIKARNLPPGDYEVKAYLSQGQTTTEQSRSFSVAGGVGDVTATAEANWFEGTDTNLDAAGELMESDSNPRVQLAIEALPTPVPAPAQDEAHLLVEAARQQALSYSEFLPNFTCTEVTRRSVDANGEGKWRLRDTLVELLSFRDSKETRTTLEVNGRTSDIDRQALKGTFSAGEFGGVLQAVFREASKADFQWRETDSLNGGTVQVYDYRVDHSNSTFSVTGSNGKQLSVGFHGQVFIDSGARRARRVTLIADNLPDDFPTHATSIGVDYDYVAINGLKYLMPVSAELKVIQARHEARMNTMEFKDYRRAAANEKVVGSDTEEKP
jgi:VWFA-related protein